MPVVFQFFLYARCYFLKGKLYLDAYIASANSCASSPSATATTSEKRLKRASTITKYVPELAEYVFHIHVMSPLTTAAGAAHTLVSETVVACFFICIAE